MSEARTKRTRKKQIKTLVIALLGTIALLGLLFSESSPVYRVIHQSRVDRQLAQQLPQANRIPAVDWGTVTNYFTITDMTFEQRLLKEPLPRNVLLFRFTAQAKQNFSGTMHAYFYDASGRKLCVELVGCAFGKAPSHYLATVTWNSSLKQWEVGDRDTGELSLPHDIAKVEVQVAPSSSFGQD